MPTSATAAHRQSATYENILVNMADGVISLDLEGRIMTFNPAAGRILGLDPEAVIGRAYAEFFFDDAGYDDLNELVLKAIYEAETTHSEEIELRLAQEEISNLLVSTTFLHARSGAGDERLGIIVVINDVTEQRKRKKVKRLFGEYLDPRIVDGILNGDLEAGGTRQTMTVSFCDLEGFTGLGETLDADALIEFVNTYLAVMLPPIGLHGGVTDKYIGDAIMAFWGPPFTRSGDPATEACHAALEQRAALGELRRRVRDELRLPIDSERIEMRCGIATGEVVAGSIGPRQSPNFTVIGDRVNVAARLETANKMLGSRILVCEETRRRAAEAFEFRELDTIQVRGRVQPERVFELVGRNNGERNQ